MGNLKEAKTADTFSGGRKSLKKTSIGIQLCVDTNSYSYGHPRRLAHDKCGSLLVTEHHGLHYSSALRSHPGSYFVSGDASCTSPEQKSEPPGVVGSCQPERHRWPAGTKRLQNNVLAVCQRIRGQVPFTPGRCCCSHKCLPTVLCLEMPCKHHSNTFNFKWRNRITVFVYRRISFSV